MIRLKDFVVHFNTWLNTGKHFQSLRVHEDSREKLCDAVASVQGKTWTGSVELNCVSGSKTAAAILKEITWDHNNFNFVWDTSGKK